jgi:hypothetical protein
LTLFHHSSIPFFQNVALEFLGDHSEGETPVPISNTEVKPFNADGTAWEAVWESRTLPRFKDTEPTRNGGLFYLTLR